MKIQPLFPYAIRGRDSEAAKFWNAVCIEESIPEVQRSSFAGSLCGKAGWDSEGEAVCGFRVFFPTQRKKEPVVFLRTQQKTGRPHGRFLQDCFKRQARRKRRDSCLRESIRLLNRRQQQSRGFRRDSKELVGWQEHESFESYL